MKRIISIVILLATMLTLPFTVSAAEADEQENEISIDGVELLPQNSSIIELTYEEYLANRDEMENLIDEANRRILSGEDGIDIKLDMEALGYYIFSEEQKQQYYSLTMADSTENVLTRGTGIDDGNIYYPAVEGIDMYVTYYTVSNNSGVAQSIAEVIMTHATGENSVLVQNYDAVEMFDNVKISNYVDKTLKTVASNVVSSLLPTGVSFAADTIISGVSPMVPSSNYSNKATLTLMVSSVSTLSHMWRKANDNKYYFRLATNSAMLRESWVLRDNGGNHYYFYNECKMQSPNYRSYTIAANQTDYTSYRVADIKYQAKGFLGIFFTKLKVSPYYAGHPLSLG